MSSPSPYGYFLPIPHEVMIVEIFSRLPVKAIASWRCVSKLWASMLAHQDLPESFLKKSRARPQMLFACKARRKYIFFSSPQPQNPEEPSYVVATNHLAPFPLSYGFYGCTNGLFCYEAQSTYEGMKDPVINPVVCNPSTGQSLRLPRLVSGRRCGVESYLGYDPMATEFKVLAMTSRRLPGGGHLSLHHKVLTLGTKDLSWRAVECPPVLHASSSKWICIDGIIYYTAAVISGSRTSMVACFSVKTETFTFVKFSETFTKPMCDSSTLVNYGGKLGLVMSRSSSHVISASKRFELWVLEDGAKSEWSRHVYAVPPSWEDVVSDSMRIAGMVGTTEIVFSPCKQYVHSYVVYFNVEKKSVIKVQIQGMEAFKGRRFHIYLNHVENVKLF